MAFRIKLESTKYGGKNMAAETSVLDNVKVIKRNGKKVDFDATKIAIAIKKGFDSVEVDVDEDQKVRKYNTQDVQKVYQAVLKKLEKLAKDTDKFEIEQIQNLIEDELEDKGYDDVYKSFSEYR